MTNNDNDTEYDCDRHKINYPPGYDRCPRCEQEDNIAAQRRHDATRDPTLEPW